MYTYSRVPQNLGQGIPSPLGCRQEGIRTGNTRIRAWQGAEGCTRTGRGSGLAEGWKGAPGPAGDRAWQRAGRRPRTSRGSGLAGAGRACGPEMRRRAWVGAGRACQDRNSSNLGLGGGTSGPGPKPQEVGLADAGCDRNNSDLQNAGTLIQLPGLYRAYERERSVKIPSFHPIGLWATLRMPCPVL